MRSPGSTRVLIVIAFAAVLLGWFLAAEPLTLRMLMAAAIIVASVALITTFGQEHATPAAPNSVHDSDCPTHPCA